MLDVRGPVCCSEPVLRACQRLLDIAVDLWSIASTSAIGLSVCLQIVEQSVTRSVLLLVPLCCRGEGFDAFTSEKRSRGRASGELAIMHGRHPGQRLHCVQIEGGQGCVERWRTQDAAEQHAGPFDIGGEAVRTCNDVSAVNAMLRLSEYLPVIDGYQADVRGKGLIVGFGEFRRSREIPVCHLAISAGINGCTFAHVYAAGRYFPLLCCCGQQKLPCGGGGAAHLRDCRGRRPAAGCDTVVRDSIGVSHDHADPVKRYGEFLGGDHGEFGSRSLPFLNLAVENGDDAVIADMEPGFERAGGGGALPSGIALCGDDQQTGADGSEELPACPHGRCRAGGSCNS